MFFRTLLNYVSKQTFTTSVVNHFASASFPNYIQENKKKVHAIFFILWKYFCDISENAHKLSDEMPAGNL